MTTAVTSTELDEVEPKPGCCMGMRHVMALLMFLGTTMSYATRVSMSVSIVAMTSNNTYGHPTFAWERATQDTVLSSFFWGYVLLQVPAGVLAARVGGKFLMLAAMAVTGAANLALPIAAEKGDWIAVCACRVVMGLTQGLLYPSIHGALGHWAPTAERGRLATFVYAGAQFGTIVELLVSGLLSASSWGWPAVFYSSGALCLAWAALWLLLADSTPATSRWISQQEREYIERNVLTDELGHNPTPTPWRAILTSLPFWSVLLAHCAQNLGFWTLLTELPSYMKNVLHVDIKQNGQLSSLPYLAMFILSFVFSWSSDLLVNKQYVRSVTARKIFNSIGHWGPAVSLLGLSYLPGGDLRLAVLLLTVTVGLNGAHYVGFMLSHIDLSPNHASTLMGLTNGFSSIFSIMAPLSVSAVVTDETNAGEWRKVFFFSIGFYILGNLFYLLFVSGDVQPWNDALGDGTEESGEKKEAKQKRPIRRLSLGESKF